MPFLSPKVDPIYYRVLVIRTPQRLPEEVEQPSSYSSFTELLWQAQLWSGQAEGAVGTPSVTGTKRQTEAETIWTNQSCFLRLLLRSTVYSIYIHIYICIERGGWFVHEILQQCLSFFLDGEWPASQTCTYGKIEHLKASSSCGCGGSGLSALSLVGSGAGLRLWAHGLE